MWQAIWAAKEYNKSDPYGGPTDLKWYFINELTNSQAMLPVRDSQYKYK